MLLAIAVIFVGTAPQAGAPPAERARANLSSYFSNDDYPEASYRRGAEGTVHFSLEIDVSGAPSRCNIEYSSGDADLDRATCDILMSRARFRPARDSNGHPAPDRVSSRVRWVLPEPVPGFPFEPYWMASAISMNAGRIECRWWATNLDPRRQEGSDCAEVAGRQLMDFVRNQGADTELTEYWRVQPDGTAPPSAEPEIAGELLLETTARISVAPDGHVADCRTTSRIVHRALFSESQFLDLCQASVIVSPQAFWPERDSSEPKLGAFTYRIYLRGGRMLD